MDENTSAPSVHPNSKNQSSENVQIGFTGLGISSRGEEAILAHEPNEELAPPLSKKRKGRPLGSKNKQKEPMLVSEEVDKIHIILIDAGIDIVEYLLNFAQRHNASITVLNGSGLVSDVTLLDHVSRASAFPIKGTFNMLALEGTYNNPNCGHVPPQLITNPPCSSFSIHLSGAEGNVFCGTIGGNVKAAGQVLVTATLSKKPMFYEMDLINRNIEEVEEGDEGYVVGVISNQDRVIVEPNNTNNIVGANSSPQTRKPSPRIE